MTPETVTEDFAQLAEELRRLPDDRLLQGWKDNSEALAALRAGQDLRTLHRLHQRHYAFRIAAIERFGALGHVERYRAITGQAG